MWVTIQGIKAASKEKVHTLQSNGSSCSLYGSKTWVRTKYQQNSSNTNYICK